MDRLQDRRAFTLIELLVVIAIIAILAAILFPVFAKARDKAQQSACLNNAVQLGRAIRIYADDNNDRAAKNWWNWNVPLEPYVKSADVFQCPTSKMPRIVKHAFAAGQFVDGNKYPAGEYWTNSPGFQYPAIFGNYAKNQELLQNYGQNDTSATHPFGMFKAPAAVIFISEVRGAVDDMDRDHFSENNGPYLEPRGTTWEQMYNALSDRHNGGCNNVFVDGHASWKKHSWFETAEGRYAICPPRSGPEWTLKRAW